MAAEFHRKTATLFEEFKKRELHFLNTELNLNSNVNWKNTTNLPLQEYMQKIHKREQETEKTYKDLMRQMEELGKHTDQMTLKLEKLNALRHAAVTSNVSAWPAAHDTYDKTFQPYYSNTLHQTTPKILSSSSLVSDFPPRILPDISLINHSFQLPSSKPNYHSVTTQTEYIFCDNCNFPLILNQETPVSNVNLPSRISPKTISKENEQNHSYKTAGTIENMGFSRGSLIKNHNIVPTSDRKFSDPQLHDHNDSRFMNERMSSELAEISFRQQDLINKQIERRISKSNIDNGELTNESFQKRMSKSDIGNVVTEGFTNTLLQKRMSQSYGHNVVNDEFTRIPAHARLTQSYTDNVVNDELTRIPAQTRLPQTYTDNVVNDELTRIPAQTGMSQSYTDNVVNDEIPRIPAQTKMSESYIDDADTGDYVTHTEEKQYIELQDNDLLSNDGNFEQVISKSDDESMSHEFNFLDSGKSKIPKRQPFIEMSGEVNSQLADNETLNERYENTQLEASYAVQSNSNNLLQIQPTSGSREKMGVDSKDLAYSPGPLSTSAQSENTSVISESDSFSEKETPLTATAAYQALLGNVSATKPKQKSVPISDSDSEDEIENALANAVRRTSNITFDTVVSDPKAEKRKESIAEAKTERNTKSMDSVSVNKPQNKLSKNTRKVLGLDTSSGSEVELEVKSPTNKIEEESDEFDFYD